MMDRDTYPDAWIQTFSGRKMYVLDPRVEDINILDIAHALSNICRFTGHCERFYSVAEHCCLMADASIRNEGGNLWRALWCLLHDASEAYLTDIARPVKPHLTDYKAFENRLSMVIQQKFNLGYEEPLTLKEFDNRILIDEYQQNMKIGPKWTFVATEPLGVTLKFWSPVEAKAQFLDRFHILTA